MTECAYCLFENETLRRNLPVLFYINYQVVNSELLVVAQVHSQMCFVLSITRGGLLCRMDVVQCVE